MKKRMMIENLIKKEENNGIYREVITIEA